MNKQTFNNMKKAGDILTYGVLAGLILVFVSVWMNGWIILRLFITGVLVMIVCAIGIQVMGGE